MTDNTLSSPTTEIVDPNTDDLDEFSKLMFGKAKEKTLEEPEEAPEDDNAETENTEDVTLEEPEAEAEEVETPKPRKKSAQDRIKELTAEKYERDRIVEAERAEKAALKSRLDLLEAQLKPTTPAPKTEDTGPDPTKVDENGLLVYPLGEFDPKYIRDLTRYTIAQEQATLQARAETERQRRALDEYNMTLTTNWNNRVKEIEKTLPDFSEKEQELVSKFAGIDPMYGNFLAQTIMGMDKGTEVLYHLANNPSEAQDIINKGPVAAALALGRIESRYVTETKPKPRTSQAPAKTPPTARGVAGEGEVRGDTDDLDAFMEVFLATKKKR